MQLHSDSHGATIYSQARCPAGSGRSARAVFRYWNPRYVHDRAGVLGVCRENRVVEYVRSYAQFADMPPYEGREYCVLGRSNVGKSSFLNHVFAQKKLAHVSSTPGKTKMVNVFRAPDGVQWVDLPGYGFAAVARNDKKAWSQLIADYCSQRSCLRGVVWLLDIRHPGMTMDLEAGHWLAELELPVLPVLTKADKLTRNQQHTNVREYVKAFGFADDPVVYSVESGTAREGFWKRFAQWTPNQKNAGKPQ